MCGQKVSINPIGMTGRAPDELKRSEGPKDSIGGSPHSTVDLRDINAVAGCPQVCPRHFSAL
jgi:hypothetical protein